MQKIDEINQIKLEDSGNQLQFQLINSLFVLFKDQQEKIDEEIQLKIKQEEERLMKEQEVKEKFYQYKFQKEKYAK